MNSDEVIKVGHTFTEVIDVNGHKVNVTCTVTEVIPLEDGTFKVTAEASYYELA